MAASYTWQNFDLNDPSCPDLFKNAKNKEGFLVAFYKCFNDLQITDFDVIIHFNVSEILKLLIDERETMKNENQALATAATEVMEKIDVITACFAKEEETKKILEQSNQQLSKRVEKLVQDHSADIKRIQEVSMEKSKLQKEYVAESKKLQELLQEAENQVNTEKEEHKKVIDALKLKYKEELEECRREWNAQLDSKIKECAEIQKKLDDSQQTVKQLKSNKGELIKEHKAKTAELQTQIDQLRQTMDSTTKQNQELIAELENIKQNLDEKMQQLQRGMDCTKEENEKLSAELDGVKQKLDESNKKRMLLNELAMVSGKKAALFVKQKKELEEKKMIQEMKNKKESVESKKKDDDDVDDSMTHQHEKCEKQIQELATKLKIKEEILEEVEKERKDYEDKRQQHIHRANLVNANMEEVVNNVENQNRKRPRTNNNSSAPSTSSSVGSNPQLQYQQQQQPQPLQQHQQYNYQQHHNPYYGFPQRFPHNLVPVMHPQQHVMFNQHLHAQNQFVNHPINQHPPYFFHPALAFQSSAPHFKNSPRPQQQQQQTPP